MSVPREKVSPSEFRWRNHDSHTCQHRHWRARLSAISDLAFGHLLQHETPASCRRNQGRADPKRGMLSVVYAGIEEEGGCKVTKGASAIGMDKSFGIVPDLRAEYK